MKNNFSKRNRLNLIILIFDKQNKRIILSALAIVKDKTDEEIAADINDYKLEKVTIADVRNSDLGKYDYSYFDLLQKKATT